MLNKILAALAFVATLFGLYQRNRADRSDAEAQRQSGRADAAQAESDTLTRVNGARTSVQKKHQQEKRDAQERIDAGDRSHLDNSG